MNTPKIVIIIPTYNEADGIADTITQVFTAAKTIMNKDIHVLVFDSASLDNTQEIITSLQKDYPSLHLKTEAQKSGLGSAYMQAMRYAMEHLCADAVVEFDADLSHQPQYLAPMLEQLETNEVVIGSRYVKGGSIPKNWSRYRKLLSGLGNLIARLFLSSHYRDWTSGFRVTKSHALKKALPPQFMSNQYAYKLQLFWALHKIKARIHEYPIAFIDRTKGKSKLPSNSIFDSIKVLFLLRLIELKSYFKMCLVGLSGMFLQLLVYNLLSPHLSSLTTAAKISVLAAIINNFILNNLYTFKQRPFLNTIQKIKAFSIFSAYSIWMICLQSYWFTTMTQTIGNGALKENLILFSGAVIGSGINYISYSRFVWLKKNSEKNMAESS